MCSLYAGGCRGWALFAGGVGGAADAGGAGGDAMCATLYDRSVEGDALCAHCMLEAVEGGLCLVLEALEVIRCVLFVCWGACRVGSVLWR